MGYSSVTPYFTVENADQLMAFLESAFGATLIKESRYLNGRVQHARMLVGDSVIMMNEGSAAYPVNVSQMHLFVEDCDSTYDVALLAGATSIMEPNGRPHGDRMAGVTDPCGNIWWLATHQPSPQL